MSRERGWLTVAGPAVQCAVLHGTTATLASMASGKKAQWISREEYASALPAPLSRAGRPVKCDVLPRTLFAVSARALAVGLRKPSIRRTWQVWDVGGLTRASSPPR